MTQQQMQRTNGGTAGAGDSLRKYLENPGVTARLQEVAASYMEPREMVRLALLAASRNQMLLQCSPDSILRALMDAAALGIKPGGLMGRGYLVPRKNNKTQKYECNFDPGYRGMVDVARRGGTIKRIEAHVVREKDVFRYTFAPFTELHHEPYRGPNRGRVIASYAAVEFTHGGVQIEVLEAEDLARIRAKSAAGEKGPWGDWEDEMARKSAVRRLCKLLPYDPVLERALEVTEEDEAAHADLVPIEAPAEKPAAKRLAEKIQAKKAPLEMPPESEPAVAGEEVGNAESEPPADADEGP